LPTNDTNCENIIKAITTKRKYYGYNTKTDKTLIFVDGDDDKIEVAKIKEIKKFLPKDITIVFSNPCFELWFLNHFVSHSHSLNSAQLLIELRKNIPEYKKSKDVFSLLKNKREIAIKNTISQNNIGNDDPYSDIVNLFVENVLEEKKAK
jgi:hypothetical protein